jgi:hypothetical protein
MGIRDRMRVMERAAEALLPDRQRQVVLRQPRPLPALAPFLQDGPNRLLPLPGADASAALQADVRHRPSAMPADTTRETQGGLLTAASGRSDDGRG